MLIYMQCDQGLQLRDGNLEINNLSHLNAISGFLYQSDTTAQLANKRQGSRWSSCQKDHQANISISTCRSRPWLECELGAVLTRSSADSPSPSPSPSEAEARSVMVLVLVMVLGTWIEALEILLRLASTDMRWSGFGRLVKADQWLD